MTPAQWARVLRAGKGAVANFPDERATSPAALAFALGAMADEADLIAEETA